jgi:hypothetical protein
MRTLYWNLHVPHRKSSGGRGHIDRALTQVAWDSNVAKTGLVHSSFPGLEGFEEKSAIGQFVELVIGPIQGVEKYWWLS